MSLPNWQLLLRDAVSLWRCYISAALLHPHMFPSSPGWVSAIGYSVLVLVHLATQECSGWWTFVCMSNSYTLHICFYSHPCQFLYLLWQAERQSIEAVPQSSQILWNYRKDKVTELPFLHTWYLQCFSEKATQVPETGPPTPEASLLERGKENAYSVEPELHNGCIVELIDFSAHGD